MSVLDEIVAGVREDLAVREARRPLEELKAAALDARPALDAAGRAARTGRRRHRRGEAAQPLARATSPPSPTRPSWPPSTRPAARGSSAC